MNPKKKISISIGSKGKEPQNEIIQAKEELSAASDPKEKKPNTGLKLSTSIYELPYKGKLKTPASLKSMIMTSLTALLISLGLGFLLLRMFVSITNEATPGNGSTAAVADGDVQSQQGASVVSSLSLDTYIVQAGVFSSESKAEDWQSNIQSQSVESVIWERDGSYYLFVGSAATEEEASQLASQIAAHDIDTYVKPWDVKTKEITGKESASLQKLGDYLSNNNLSSVPAAERQSLLESVQKIKQQPDLIAAVKTWADGDKDNIAWMLIAHALENK
ncbi:SPOR domain-containing protein [Halobacillus rhizosphaerae]|uniref:SPOR domain-containing protein n=1 Tax=Halobacillus rhizosphaerae TaxID=3064889 RepID=UPI00398B120F